MEGKITKDLESLQEMGLDASLAGQSVLVKAVSKNQEVFTCMELDNGEEFFIEAKHVTILKNKDYSQQGGNKHDKFRRKGNEKY